MNQKTNEQEVGYQRYILISPSRGGSWFLISLLSSHNDIISLGEVFHEDEIAFDHPDFNSNNKMVLLRNSDREGFLKKEVFKRYTQNIKAVGFKFLYYQLNFPEHVELNRYLKKEKDIKIIHLKRENHLNRLISFKIAEKTGQWRSKSLNDVKKISKVCFSLDDDECRDFFIQGEQDEIRFDNMFKHHEVLNLNYEDLVKFQTGKCSEILKFLGVDDKALSTKYFKQNLRSQSDVILNYDKLKFAFKNTQWSRLFTDKI
ncbi:sulfotransferase [Candidatus Woesearchaeota archaeon]|nr:sulfotransferase [Candidatus Woesearchaeota archaeon]